MAGLGFILFQIKMGAKDLTQYLEEKDKCGQIVKDWAIQVRGE